MCLLFMQLLRRYTNSAILAVNTVERRRRSNLYGRRTCYQAESARGYHDHRE